MTVLKLEFGGNYIIWVGKVHEWINFVRLFVWFEVLYVQISPVHLKCNWQWSRKKKHFTAQWEESCCFTALKGFNVLSINLFPKPDVVQSILCMTLQDWLALTLQAQECNTFAKWWHRRALKTCRQKKKKTIVKLELFFLDDWIKLEAMKYWQSRGYLRCWRCCWKVINKDCTAVKSDFCINWKNLSYAKLDLAMS